MLELLLLDRSASEDETQAGPSRKRPRVNGESRKDDFYVDESWRPEGAEETALEILVAAIPIRMAKGESTGGRRYAIFLIMPKNSP